MSKLDNKITRQIVKTLRKINQFVGLVIIALSKNITARYDSKILT